MATVETPMILSKIVKSAATAQYYLPRTRPKNFYISSFSLPREKFESIIKQRFLDKTDPLMPPYPHGKDNRFPEANLGLYGGAVVQTGSKISKGRNKGKTLRTWFPNVKIEKLKSEFLDFTYTLPVTAAVKRTIAKCGGLDQYLLGNQPARIRELGLTGWKLRWHIMRSPKYIEHMARHKKGANAVKTTANLSETFEQVWADPVRREKLIQRQVEKWDALREKDEKFRRHFKKLLIGDKMRKRVPSISTLKLLSPDMLNLPEKIVEVSPTPS